MKLITEKRPKTNADKCARYRARKGDDYRAKNRNRMRACRASAIPKFIGVDSEGIGKGKNHRAVLLGVGDKQCVAGDIKRGLVWQEVFEFLYQQYETEPRAAYVGFYLSYDFNQWLKTLPPNAAWLLLHKKGRAMRKMKGPETARRRQYHPVRVDGWEIDMLGFKRLSIRPRVCTCTEDRTKCTHKQRAWMHICDAGPFFQMSFKNVLEPKRWMDDPDGPICTQREWNKIFVGKEKRASALRITKEMCEYNKLENLLLSRCMERLAKGFAKVGIKLGKDQWYGPGASASKWLQQQGAVKHRDLNKYIPEWFIDICRKSYFGGWFEIFSHGLIMGESFNYDINNAYPFATTKLPHLCDKCRSRNGKGHYKGMGKFVLLYATVYASGNRIGPMPYRDKNGSILRPCTTRGWYWASELQAANRAGLVKSYTTHEWAEFIPCEHPNPFTDIQRLYDLRLEVGKDSAQGMAIKLNNNSAYGKFAQSVGGAPYNNWFYASYITSHCRSQILDAIASHPRKADSVLMVATDGICFDSVHPELHISKKLGEWSATTYTDLCLFKPGVYWHHEGKEALLKVKSRGVPKDEFAMAIESVEYQFRIMHDTGNIPGSTIVEHIISAEAEKYDIPIGSLRGVRGWPHFRVPVKFRVKSCKQALNEGRWENAGTVQEQVWLLQDSDPQNKRRRPRYNYAKRRIDTIIHDLSLDQIETKYYGDVHYPTTDIGYGYEGSAIDPILETASILRDKPANYDLPLGEDIEWETVWGGNNE